MDLFAPVTFDLSGITDIIFDSPQSQPEELELLVDSDRKMNFGGYCVVS